MMKKPWNGNLVISPGDELLAALMGAGKYFYGIITEIHGIKVIRGEERGTFQGSFMDSDENDRQNNSGEEGGEEFFSLRPEKEDSFLYDYSDHVWEVVHTKGPYWEYQLYLDLLDINLYWLQPFRKLSNRKEPSWVSNVYRQLEDPEELKDLLTLNYENLRAYVEQLNKGLEEAVMIASGRRKENNPSKALLQIVIKQMDVFKTVIHWMLEMKSIEVMPEFMDGFDEYINYGFDIREFYDELHRWAIKRSERDSLLEDDNRRWFVTAFERLIVLTGE